MVHIMKKIFERKNDTKSKKQSKDDKIVSLLEVKPRYTTPLMYALAAVNTMDIPKEFDYNLNDEEKISLAAQIAGINKDDAIHFCIILKKLYND